MWIFIIYSLSVIRKKKMSLSYKIDSLQSLNEHFTDQ